MANGRPPAATRAATAFRELLRRPKAKPVQEQLAYFINEFPLSLTKAEAAKRIHTFISRMRDMLLSMFDSEIDEESRIETTEGLEKILLGKLYEKLFTMDPADSTEDENLHTHISGLRWVEFRNLGVAPAVDPGLLALAVEQLQQMSRFKAPRDKLICIVNACHVISNVLSKAKLEDAATSMRPVSADDFLPLLIYAVLTANPPSLHSNLEFVATFRHPSRLVAEDAYFFTCLQSAVAFVKAAGPKALDVTPEEFDQLYAEALQQGRVDKAKKPQGVAAALQAVELTAVLRERLRDKLSAQPLRFVSLQTTEQLRVQEIPALVEEYAELAKLVRSVAEGTL